MGIGKNWTQSEMDYLEEKWGTISIPAIGKNLGRTVSAVKNKAYKSGLTRHLHSGEYITCNQLLVALGRLHSGGYIDISWVQNRGLPVKYKKSIKKNYKVVYIDEFWKWAEKHRTFLNFAKIEKGILGEEPDWVQEQRKADEQFYTRFKMTPWSEAQDSRLLSMLKQNRYTYRQISVALGRTEGALKRRMCDLGTKLRPLREHPHGKWTDSDVAKLIDLYKKGYKSELIADHINKSALAINGKIERLQKAGNL